MDPSLNPYNPDIALVDVRVSIGDQSFSWRCPVGGMDYLLRYQKFGRAEPKMEQLKMICSEIGNATAYSFATAITAAMVGGKFKTPDPEKARKFNGSRIPLLPLEAWANEMANSICMNAYPYFLNNEKVTERISSFVLKKGLPDPESLKTAPTNDAVISPGRTINFKDL